MTAEETALEEFREAVREIRLWRRNERRFLAQIQRAKEPDRIARLAMATEASRCGKSEAIACVRSLARIIRAIRAERVTPSLEWVDLRPAHVPLRELLALAHEQGLRDFARRVQGACLFEHARMFARTNKADPWMLDHGYMNALINLAKAAEEAAR